MKKIISIVCSLGMMSLFVTACAQPAAPQNNQTQSQTAQKADITEDKAKEIALKDAGVKEADITITKLGFDGDDAVAKYDVEFNDGQMEYDYEIDATNGDIISRSKEPMEGAPQNNTTDNKQTNQNENLIGEEKALQIAMEHAGINPADASYQTCHLDYDDGLKVYDVDFRVGNTEYSYDIDATNGNIVSQDIDVENGIDD